MRNTRFWRIVARNYDWWRISLSNTIRQPIRSKHSARVLSILSEAGFRYHLREAFVSPHPFLERNQLGRMGFAAEYLWLQIARGLVLILNLAGTIWTMNDKLLVIILHSGSIEDTLECLNSLQKYIHSIGLDIFVVDNGPDRQIEAVLKAAHPNVTYHGTQVSIRVSRPAITSACVSVSTVALNTPCCSTMTQLRNMISSTPY